MREIKPLPGIVYIKLEKPKAGILDTSSRASAIQYAEVRGVGDDVTSVKVGDKVFVMSWAIDSVTYDDERYDFVNIASGGILAVVNDDSRM